VAPEVVSAVTATAAGAILAMLIDTMIPEAFAESHALAGLVAVAGFLCAFALSKHAESSPDESTQSSDSARETRTKLHDAHARRAR